jgi:hypothetical protein
VLTREQRDGLYRVAASLEQSNLSSQVGVGSQRRSSWRGMNRRCLRGLGMSWWGPP